MKKKKLLILIPIAVIAVVAGVMLHNKNQAPQAVSVDFTPLKKATIRSTISSDGVVKSVNSVNVYSELNYQIKEVSVEVGDHVKKGDTLCTLNSDTLVNEIEKNKLSIVAASQNAQQQIMTNQKQYNDNKIIFESGFNSEINQAQDTVNTAKMNLEDAQRKLNDAKSHIDQNLNSNLISARSEADSKSTTLSRAQKDLSQRLNELGSGYKDLERQYNKDYEKYQRAVKNKSDDEDELKKIYLDTKNDLAKWEQDADKDYEYISDHVSIKQMRQNVTDAEQAYNTAQKNLAAAQKAVDEELTAFQTAVKTAQTNYNSALKAQKATLASVQKSLEKDQLAVQTSIAAANDEAQRAELQASQSQLKKCIITAPVSGTITAVYAIKGSPANGLLFIIEDTNALELSIKLKEYDVNNVKEGMSALIQSDSTGNDQYEGYLEKIAPTAIKANAEAQTTDTSTSTNKTNAEFAATVLVSSANTKLKIGMNAKADIILKQSENVFSVPFEAIGTDENGKNVVYTAQSQKDGTYITKAVPVTMGIETDSEIEITGKDLKSGMLIISDAKQITNGITVMTNTTQKAAQGAVQ